MAKRIIMSGLDWDDVADLCEQAAQACEIAYEEHTVPAKITTAKWFRRLAMKACEKSEATRRARLKP